MKKIVLNELLFLIVLLFLISGVHADETLLPSSGIGFQGSESSVGEDHTSYIQNVDGNWAPPTTIVPNNYYATGLDANFWDALSVKFDTNEYDPSEYTAFLRFYAKKGSYWNKQWYHYIILKGEKNPKYQDADWEAVSNNPNVHSISNSGGSWIEEVLPSSYWNSGSFWVTLRMWNVKVDAVELVLIPNEPPSITVTSPNGGEVWVVGGSRDITWTSSGNVGSTVNIELLKGGEVYRTIGTVPNNGDYSMFVMWPGTDYKIRITSVTYPEITDASDNSFTILSDESPSIHVTSPDGGETWVKGSTHSITWTGSGNLGLNFNIELLKGGVVYQTLATTANHGSFSWTLLSSYETGTDYKIRISSATDPEIMDASNGNFAITSTSSGSITVQEPNSDTHWWWWDSKYDIKWSYTGSPGSKVKLELFKGDNQVASIAVVPIGTNGVGSYTWTVPMGIEDSPPGVRDYSVHVQSISDSAIIDSSDYFPIYHQFRDDAVAFNYQNLNSLSKEIGMNVRILTQTPYSYYTAFSWTGQGMGTVGYYGIQSEGSTYPNKHVHFTVWDTPDGKETSLVTKSDDVSCNHNCDREGCAMICIYNYNWQVNHDYKLVVNVENVGETTQYQALFYPDEMSQPKQIATLAFQKKDTWINKFLSFIEDFEYYPQHCGSLYYRSVLFGKGYRKDQNDTIFHLNSAEYVPNGGCGNHDANVQYFNNIGYFSAETGSGVVERTPSNSVLKIIDPTTGHITVTSPNSGEVWVAGGSRDITWTSSGNVGSTVNIELLKGGVVYRTIGIVPNNGDYSWMVLNPGTDYKIRITSVTYPEITDTSDNSFAILMDDTYPVADFGGKPLSGGAPLDVGFTDQSTGPLITNWHWDFGDGVIANYGTKTNPSHRYTDAGTYSVTLTVTNAVGSNTRNRPNYITVTSIPVTLKTTHIGIFRPGSGIWSLDSNGNFAWEGSDATLSWGLPGDLPVIGDWNGDTKDDIGIFRPSSGIWSLDSNGNNAWEGSDATLSWGLPGDLPVIGDWNGDTKDDIGIFRPSSGIWSLDSNGNFAWEGSDVSMSWGLPNDNPVIGDWNGDTKDDIGIFRPSSGIWSLDSNGNFAWEGSDVSMSWGLPNDKPTVGKY